jgi:hypothetical protein
MKVGDTRTPGLPVKSGLGKHDYASARCAFSKIEYTSAGSPVIGNSFGNRQVGHRSDRSQACEALKDWVRQEDGEWACHFISAREFFFNKDNCDQNQEHLLDGARDGKPSS